MDDDALRSSRGQYVYLRQVLYAVRSTLEVAVEKLGSDMIGSGRVVSRERWLWRNLKPHLST
jgi:hypothetical protein